VISADGNNERQITHDRAFNIHPAWNPDGRSIMYSSTRDSKDWRYGKADIWQTFVVDKDGSNQRKLPVPGPVNTYGSWSPEAPGFYSDVSRPMSPGFQTYI
jgi:TolB protein